MADDPDSVARRAPAEAVIDCPYCDANLSAEVIDRLRSIGGDDVDLYLCYVCAKTSERRRLRPLDTTL